MTDWPSVTIAAAAAAIFNFSRGCCISRCVRSRSESALANYICAECAQGRTDADTAVFIGEAEKDAKLIMNNSDVKLKQRRPVQRKAYSGRRNTNGQLWGNAGY